MIEEEFTVGQKVKFRDDWLAKHRRSCTMEQALRLNEWLKLPHMTVKSIDNGRDSGSNVKLGLEGYDGTWTCDAITAYEYKEVFDEDLFCL